MFLKQKAPGALWNTWGLRMETKAEALIPKGI